MGGRLYLYVTCAGAFALYVTCAGAFTLYVTCAGQDHVLQGPQTLSVHVRCLA